MAIFRVFKHLAIDGDSLRTWPYEILSGLNESLPRVDSLICLVHSLPQNLHHLIKVLERFYHRKHNELGYLSLLLIWSDSSGGAIQISLLHSLYDSVFYLRYAMALNTAKRKIQEFVQALGESTGELSEQNREPEHRSSMDHQTKEILLEVAGILSDASKKVMDLLRQGSAASLSSASGTQPGPSQPTNNGGSSSPLDRIQEFEPGPKMQEEEAPRRRAPKGSFAPSKSELETMYSTMSAREIGEKHGVSASTVNLRLRDLGISKPGRNGKKGGRGKK